MKKYKYEANYECNDCHVGHIIKKDNRHALPNSIKCWQCKKDIPMTGYAVTVPMSIEVDDL